MLELKCSYVSSLQKKAKITGGIFVNLIHIICHCNKYNIMELIDMVEKSVPK